MAMSATLNYDLPKKLKASNDIVIDGGKKPWNRGLLSRLYNTGAIGDAAWSFATGATVSMVTKFAVMTGGAFIGAAALPVAIVASTSAGAATSHYRFMQACKKAEKAGQLVPVKWGNEHIRSLMIGTAVGAVGGYVALEYGAQIMHFLSEKTPLGVVMEKAHSLASTFFKAAFGDGSSASPVPLLSAASAPQAPEMPQPASAPAIAMEANVQPMAEPSQTISPTGKTLHQLPATKAFPDAADRAVFASLKDAKAGLNAPVVNNMPVLDAPRATLNVAPAVTADAPASTASIPTAALPDVVVPAIPDVPAASEIITPDAVTAPIPVVLTPVSTLPGDMDFARTSVTMPSAVVGTAVSPLTLSTGTPSAEQQLTEYLNTHKVSGATRKVFKRALAGDSQAMKETGMYFYNYVKDTGRALVSYNKAVELGGTGGYQAARDIDYITHLKHIKNAAAPVSALVVEQASTLPSDVPLPPANPFAPGATVPDAPVAYEAPKVAPAVKAAAPSGLSAGHGQGHAKVSFHRATMDLKGMSSALKNCVYDVDRNGEILKILCDKGQGILPKRVYLEHAIAR